MPGKNVRLVGGMPLVGRAVRIARQAAAIVAGGPHRVVCSTDDPAIATAARAWGAEIIERPAELATPEATSLDVALHALDRVASAGERVATLVLLQPTSPLVDAADVVAAIGQHRELNGIPVASIVASHPAAWHVVPGAGGVLDRRRPANPVTTRCWRARSSSSGPTSWPASGGSSSPGGPSASPSRLSARSTSTRRWTWSPRRLLAARPVRPVPIGDRTIGDGPAFLIAEAGVNHNGDGGLAMRLIDAAADAGADAVKFQTFHPGALAAAAARHWPRTSGDAGVTASDQREMLEAAGAARRRVGGAPAASARARAHVPVDPVRRRIGGPARPTRRAGVQGRVRRADQPPVPRAAGAPRPAAAASRPAWPTWSRSPRPSTPSGQR